MCSACTCCGCFHYVGSHPPQLQSRVVPLPVGAGIAVQELLRQLVASPPAHWTVQVWTPEET